jgi:hypothetical protein
MAILRASKTFEGGDLIQRTSSYIKQGTRLVDFKNKENGVYLFLLGAYKLDSSGNGVWYKPLKIRDNFGMGMYKDKFAVQPNCPIEYFANKVQTFAPEMAKTRKVAGDDGRERPVYPVWGRTAWRVLYNAALFGDYGSGVHVLDLPMSGGGSVIDEFVRGKQADGTDNPDITDYQNAITVNIKLDLKVAGQPWKIQINQAKTYSLPVELADTDYLNNLDEVVTYPSKDELIEKLRSLVPTDIFNKGMDGYNSGDRVVVSMATPQPKKVSATAPEAESDDVPMSYENPVAQVIPKPNKSTVAPNVTIPKPNSVASEPGIPEAPVFNSASNGNALAQAAAFLKKK